MKQKPFLIFYYQTSGPEDGPEDDDPDPAPPPPT